MRTTAAYLLILSLSLGFAGCGKKGPLVYPDQLLAMPPQASVEQSGSALRVVVTLPQKDRSGRKVQDVTAVVISRRLCSDPVCADCREPFQKLQTIELASPDSGMVDGSRIFWLDNDLRLNDTAQYRVQAVQRGEVAGDMAAVTIPVRLVAVPEPLRMTARAVFGGKVALEWSPGSYEGWMTTGYIIYRAAGEGAFQQLVRLGGKSARYEDQTVQRDVIYRYAVRQVFKRADGISTEGELSAFVSAVVSDDVP